MHTTIAIQHPASTVDRLAIGPYQLRGLAYRRISADEDTWRGSLLEADRRIARLVSPRRHGPVDIRFDSRASELRALTFAAQRAGYAPNDPEFAERQHDALQELLLDLAERAYHVRALQVQARRQTLFRLRGDPEDAFRTLKDAPYSPAREGQLRLIYGQRLVEIIRGGARRDPEFLACAT